MSSQTPHKHADDILHADEQTTVNVVDFVQARRRRLSANDDAELLHAPSALDPADLGMGERWPKPAVTTMASEAVDENVLVTALVAALADARASQQRAERHATSMQLENQHLRAKMQQMAGLMLRWERHVDASVRHADASQRAYEQHVERLTACVAQQHKRADAALALAEQLMSRKWLSRWTRALYQDDLDALR